MYLATTEHLRWSAQCPTLVGNGILEDRPPGLRDDLRGSFKRIYEDSFKGSYKGNIGFCLPRPHFLPKKGLGQQ